MATQSHADLVERIAAQHVAVLGKTGSGKTYAAKGIVEQLLARRRQVCVLDPTGAWWGLRLAADGKARGFDVVLLGGKHADIPLAERSGAAVARLVTEQRASVVIDTTGFTVGEYTRWFIDFAGTLYTTVRHPLHLVVDEAHYFMPQGKAPDVDAGRMLHAGNRLMSGGRSLGIRGLLITQRPAKLHKDSLTCADTLVAMRVLAPQDRQAIKDWIDGAGDAARGREVLDSLAQLPRGEGWVWYPEGGVLRRVAFPPIRTYDSSATPAHGQTAAPDVGAIKLDEVRAAMAEAVREAEANDPKLLRAKVADLQRQLAARPEPMVERQVVERPVVTDAQVKRVESIVGRLEREGERRLKAAEELAAGGRELQQAAREFAAALRQAAGKPPAPVPSRPPATPPPARPAVQRQRPVPEGDAAAWMQPAHQRILDALAWLAAFGIPAPDRGVVAAIAGASPASSAYANNVSRLRSAGLIDYPREGAISLADEGRRLAAVPEAAPTLQALHDAWRRCPACQPAHVRILNAVIDRYPDPVSREELAAAADASPASSAFANNVSRLSSLGLIRYPAAGLVVATDLLFPPGIAG